MKVKGKKAAKAKTASRSSMVIGILLLLAIVGLFAIYRQKQPLPPNPSPAPTLLPYKEPRQYPSKRAVIKNGYALIPEFGVKFKVPPELEDVIYSFESFDDPGYQNYNKMWIVRFTTQRLLDLGPGCTAEHGSIGSAGKYVEYPTGQEINLKKIGSYYYHWSHPQATCSDNPEVQALEGKQAKLLGEVFQTLEAIK